MDNGFYLRFPQNTAKEWWHKGGTVMGLGNRRSIRLSYGANGSFPRFPPVKGQPATRRTRRKGLRMSAQGVAQSVREPFRLAARNESCWREGNSLHGGLTDGPYVASKKEASWVVWSGAGEAAYCDTKEDAMATMAALAEHWRQSRIRYIYFIGAKLRLGEPVKIGVAYNPAARLSGIQSSWPFQLRIFAVHPGDTKVEKRYHEKFKRCRMRGEWFRITPALKRVIEQHPLPSATF